MPLAVLTAVDKVHVDDSHPPGSDDDTRQWVVGLIAQWPTTTVASGYIRRVQSHQEGGETDVHIAILNGQWTSKMGSGYMKAAGEYALYVGESTLSETVIDPTPVEVFAEGAVGRLSTHWKSLSTVVEVGYASGDTNAFDRTQNTFRFDSNHRVGTILYPHLLRTLTAVSAHNIDDPNFRAEPPRGFEKLPTQGAVENSVYFTPRLMWASHPSLSVNIGWLWARSATPWSDAYRTGLNGGTATGPYGHTGLRT